MIAFPKRIALFLKTSPHSKIFIFLFYILLFGFIYAFCFAFIRDPDLGWHLRYGEEVVLNGKILKVDTFSHTFAGQDVIDTEWLVEAVFYLIFTHYSFIGLAIISALFTSLAYLIPVLTTSGSIFVKLLLVVWAVVGSSSVLEVGARAQNVSLVFFSLLFVLLLKFTKSYKKRYLLFIPVLLFIWAKAHPGFFIGLFLLFTFLFLELSFAIIELMLRRRRKKTFGLRKRLIPVVLLFGIFIISLAVLNIGSKEETAGRFSLDLMKTFALPASVVSQVPLSGSVRQTISEWKPPILIDLPGILFLLGILYSIALFTTKSLIKADLKNLIILLGFIYFSTLSRRNVPFFFLVFIPLVIPYTQEIINKSKAKRLLPYLSFLALIVMIFASIQKISKEQKRILKDGASLSSYCEALKYPCKAIEFVKQKKLTGKMFNHYNWGGYLIWTLPEYPVFIDGRVPGGEVFSEFEKVIGLKKGWQEILDKYGVKWMLVPRNLIFEDIVRIEGKWKEVYADDRSVVLIKE